MSWDTHSHSEYAPASHYHDRYDISDTAWEHHSHHDLERELRSMADELRGQLRYAEERIDTLEAQVSELLEARRNPPDTMISCGS